MSRPGVLRAGLQYWAGTALSDDCCGVAPPPAAVEPEAERPWWRDPAIVVPVASGLSFLAGLALQRVGIDTLPLVLFWIGLLLGASTFVPGAIRALVTRRRVGIAMLMTISAIGAVLLDFVEEAAALAFLYSIAEALEDKAMDRARSGLRSLLTLVPETATVVRGQSVVEVPARDVRAGELIRLRPGERAATDGIVRAGRSSLDTSAITGESIPVGVGPGDAVPAGSINSSGALDVVATADGADSSLTTLVSLVEQAQAQKGQRARLADRIARPLVPGVIVLALLVGVLGSVLGDPQAWITRALVVLVAASPCALAIAVPVTVISAIGAASSFGVIIKSGAAFESLGAVRRLAVDKTGTLTRNQPTVVDVVSTDGLDRDQLVGLAAALEQHSTHPLATAITSAADTIPAATDVREQRGNGITGRVSGCRIAVGSPRWIDPGPLAPRIAQLEADGQTCAVITRDGAVVGAIGVRDELRSEVPDVVRILAGQGIEVTMLTGDNARTAHALARAAGITDVRAELRPEDKAEIVTELSASAPTAMIGDGVNDAPALASASVGVAMGATGSDAAIESADVAFTGHDLRLMPAALRHARRGRSIMNQNVALSLLIIAVLPPLAITGALGLTAVVLVHELAEVVVIGNGMRAARRHGPGPSALSTHPVSQWGVRRSAAVPRRRHPYEGSRSLAHGEGNQAAAARRDPHRRRFR